MKKILTVLIVMITVFTMVGFSASQQLPESQNNVEQLLSDDQLLELALQAAHVFGLRGQPTEQTVLKFPANQWRMTMLGAGIDEKTVFFLSVKGDIEPGHMFGGGAYREEDVVQQAPEWQALGCREPVQR